MKYIISSWLAILLLGAQLYAQSTRTYADPNQLFKEAKQWMLEKKYNLAYPMLQTLKQQDGASGSQLTEDDRSWVEFYYIQCALHLLLPNAEYDAKNFLTEKHHANMVHMMYYHLGHYYHIRQDYTAALECYNQAGIESLTKEQLGNLKFEQGYAYFNQQQFKEAKPLFQELMLLPEHPYYVPAHYYAGFISFSSHQLDEALDAFQVAMQAPEYTAVLPYYVAEIYYEQGKKERALSYGDSVLATGSNNYYEKDLRLLVGQIHFEKQDYVKALPLIESFVEKSGKVTREVMYELSFCYYKTGKSDKAIDGFKQLSNEKDSLGQSSMYLLGTLYLNIGDKPNARNAFQYCASSSVNVLQQESARLNYAKLSGELGFQDIALKEMRAFVKDYPGSSNSAEAKELLFNLLAATNNYEDGIQLFKSISSPSADMQKIYPKLLFGYAVQTFNDQQIAQADTLFGELLALKTANPYIGYARYWKGEIAYREKRYEAAIRHLQSFIAAAPSALGDASLSNAKYTLAYSYFQNEAYKNALDLFAPLGGTLTTDASNLQADAFIRAADCHYLLKDYNAAVKKYQAYIAAEEVQTDYAMFQIAMIAGIKSGPEKIRQLNAIIQRFPDTYLQWEISKEIAQTLVAEKKFEEALTYLKIMKDDPEALRYKPEVCQLMGVVYYNLNQNDQALKAYQELFDEFSRSEEAKDALPSVRQLFLEEGKIDEYATFISKYGLNLGVNEADSLAFTAAYLKYTSGDVDKSIAGFSKYLSLYTTGVYVTDAGYYLGQCYLKKNMHDEAIASFQRSVNPGQNDYYERAALELGKLFYFQKKKFDSSRIYFQLLYDNASDNENKLEALRGIVRCDYQLGNYAIAAEKAGWLLSSKGISNDDKVIAWMVKAKSYQAADKCDSALATYKNIITVSKTNWGAEARYESASCYFKMNNAKLCEKMAMAVINETGSYEKWVTRAYLLLGDLSMKQRDYFNAKATYESVFKNASDSTIKAEADQKFKEAVLLESKGGKIKN